MTLSTIIKQFALLIFTAFLLYLAWFIHENNKETPPQLPDEPQLELFNYQIVRYDLDGFLNYVLDSTHMRHYDGEKGSELDEPYLVHYEDLPILERQIDWTAESQHAHISEDRSLITLNRDVYLYKPDEKKGEPLTVKTEQLLIHDRGDRVTTDLFITLESPSRYMEGVGMIGFPGPGQYTLLKDTRSIFTQNSEEQ